MSKHGCCEVVCTMYCFICYQIPAHLDKYMPINLNRDTIKQLLNKAGFENMMYKATWRRA